MKKKIKKYNPFTRFENNEEHNYAIALMTKFVGKGLGEDAYQAETILYINHLLGGLRR